MKKIAIFGSGGCAGEIADICYTLNYDTIVYIVPSKDNYNNKTASSYYLESEISELEKQNYSFAIGIADSKKRKKISDKFNTLYFPNLIHPDTSFGRNQIELIQKKKGIIIAAGARFMSGIHIGNFCLFGLNCTIGHDSIISDFVSIMPGAHISGNVIISKFGFIGSGAVILPGTIEEKIYLAENIQVGAGAVVTKSFLSASIVVGVPARKKLV